jgi:hypothetical protein
VLIGLFFRGLKPPAPSGIRNLKLKLIGLFFRGLKPLAPSGIRNLKLKLIGLFFRGLKPPAPSGIRDLKLKYQEPVPAKTTPMVRRMILKSSQMLQVSM